MFLIGFFFLRSSGSLIDRSITVINGTYRVCHCHDPGININLNDIFFLFIFNLENLYAFFSRWFLLGSCCLLIHNFSRCICWCGMQLLMWLYASRPSWKSKFMACDTLWGRRSANISLILLFNLCLACFVLCVLNLIYIHVSPSTLPFIFSHLIAIWRDT